MMSEYKILREIAVERRRYHLACDGDTSSYLQGVLKGLDIAKAIIFANAKVFHDAHVRYRVRANRWRSIELYKIIEVALGYLTRCDKSKAVRTLQKVIS